MARCFSWLATDFLSQPRGPQGRYCACWMGAQLCPALSTMIHGGFADGCPGAAGEEWVQGWESSQLGCGGMPGR